MKKFLILSVVALAAVSVAVTAAIAKPTKKSATSRGLRPAAGHQVVRPLGAVRQARLRQGTQGRRRQLHDHQRPERRRRSRSSQADQCLANGAKVVIIASLDAGSSIAIQKKVAAAGGRSIDYDRQVDGRQREGLCHVRRQHGRRAQATGLVDG